MKGNYKFSPQMLEALVGGLSAIDFPRLRVHDLDQAYGFIKAYGYDVEDEKDLQQLWLFHSRAVTYIRSQLLQDKEKLPELLSDPNQLKDIGYLLIYASTKGNKEGDLQSWACAVLRVMHVLVHLENDLFAQFSQSIQKQILEPFKKIVITDPVQGSLMKAESSHEVIELKKFETKSFKKSDSSITKLLIKRDAVALRILDKVGVRIVTKSLFDVFRVMRFLVENSIVNTANVIPTESNNNIYPVEDFLKAMENLTSNKEFSGPEMDQHLLTFLNEEQIGGGPKYNAFSDQNYRFIKFISRRRIKIKQESKGSLQFFYPYEVQILDYNTYVNNLSGPASHEEYKKRQVAEARQRVFGGSVE